MIISNFSLIQAVSVKVWLVQSTLCCRLPVLWVNWLDGQLFIFLTEVYIARFRCTLDIYKNCEVNLSILFNTDTISQPDSSWMFEKWILIPKTWNSSLLSFLSSGRRLPSGENDVEPDIRSTLVCHQGDFLLSWRIYSLRSLYCWRASVSVC